MLSILVCIFSKTDILIANDIIKKIIDDEKESPDIDLSLEILKFMVEAGDPELFITLAKITLKNLKVEADLLELWETVAEFYRRLDKEEKDRAIQKIIDKRSKIDGLTPIDKKDSDIEAIGATLSIS